MSNNEDDKIEVPQDPQYNGEVVVNNNDAVQENEEVKENSEKKGLLSSLFGKKEEMDCDLLLKQMRDCVNEKEGTTMCRQEVDKWEKYCKEHSDESNDEDSDENKEENHEDDKKDE